VIENTLPEDIGVYKWSYRMYRTVSRLRDIIIIIIIITNNNPDIISRDNEKGTCMLIDVAVSGGRKVIKNEAEKFLKYKDLTIEIQRM